MLQNDLIIRLLTFHFDADPDPAFHFDADSTLKRKRIRILIQLPKMMQIHADPDPQQCSFIRKNNKTVLFSIKLLMRELFPRPYSTSIAFTVIVSQLVISAAHYIEVTKRKHHITLPTVTSLRFLTFTFRNSYV